MNKNIIISLTILTIVTAVVGYFLYQWYIKKNKFGKMGGNLIDTLEKRLGKIYGCKNGEKYDSKQKKCVLIN